MNHSLFAVVISTVVFCVMGHKKQHLNRYRLMRQRKNVMHLCSREPSMDAQDRFKSWPVAVAVVAVATTTGAS